MLHPNNEQEAKGGQAFDLVMCVAFAVIAAGFAARGMQLVEEHAPDAAEAAVGLGFAALLLTGVSVALAYRFNGPRE